MNNKRPSKAEYYLKIAEEVARRSTCMRTKHGCVIVKDDQIVATGYTGAPRNTMDCFERGNCLRSEKKIPSGQRYEICRSVHSEQNALINAARAGVSVLGGDLYHFSLKVFEGKEEVVNAFPCFICKKMIINAGIKRVIERQADGSIKVYDVEKWAEEWRKKDMLDDTQKYDSKYYKKENTVEKPLIIGLTGPVGCGKGSVAEILKEKGFDHTSLSDRLREELKKKKKKITRDNLINLGNELREKEGFSTLAKRTIRKIDPKKSVVIDSIRHPEEVEELKKLGNFIMVAVVADQKTRFSRVISRARECDSSTFNEFQEKDHKEMYGQKGSSQQIAKCIKSADIIIRNESTKGSLNARTLRMLDDLMNKK